jgi:hypothetical protein
VPELELHEAIALVNEGFSPFPINAEKKMPAVKFSVETFDSVEAIIKRRFWNGVGIHLGRSMCWVLDIDGNEGYVELKKFTDQYGELPTTRTVKTGGGGMHYYWDGWNDKVKSGILTRHIHIKGNVGNAFVVTPPTLHKSGSRYEYLARRAPAPAPKWLLDLIKKDQKPEPVIRETYHGTSLSDEYGLSCMQIGAPLNARQTSDGYQGIHPFHGSESGSNFTVNTKRNIWHCFRCGSGGGPLELLAIKHAIISCDAAGPGCLEGHWAEVYNALEEDGFKSQKNEELKGIAADFLKRIRAKP